MNASHSRRKALVGFLSVGAAAVALAGCSQVEAALQPVVTAVSNDAVALYGIAKGMGEQVLTVAEAAAETLDPGLVPLVAAIKAAIATADALVSSASTTASAAASLTSQANALMLLVAPHVDVSPSPATLAATPT